MTLIRKRRQPVAASAADTVEIVLGWLADKGIVAAIVFRDEGGYQLAGSNYPALPGVLRAMAKEAESRLTTTN